MDCEGEPVQELSAIAMDNETHRIVSVYHKHADCDPSLDFWARQNIHGLNVKYLSQCGFPNETVLIADFEKWLQSLNIKCMFANNPAKERHMLPKYEVFDILLPPWEKRIDMSYHEVANRFKELNLPVSSAQCSTYIHNQYCRSRFFTTNSQVLKSLHGYHCSLFDCYEMYLFYLLQPTYM